MNNEKISPSGLILPNNQQSAIVDAAPAKTKIGGVEVDYHADPRVVATLKPEVLSDPNMLLGVLSVILNVQSALIREALAMRQALETIADSWEKGLAEGEAAGAEDTQVLPTGDDPGAQPDENGQATAEGEAQTA